MSFPSLEGFKIEVDDLWVKGSVEQQMRLDGLPAPK